MSNRNGDAGTWPAGHIRYPCGHRLPVYWPPHPADETQGAPPDCPECQALQRECSYCGSEPGAYCTDRGLRRSGFLHAIRF